jgi:pimeloyl-ACP methyl ester carboxylesterase
MATYILVSGAWHGGWCWERVVPLLEAAGHRVLAPNLLGMGGDPTPLAEVSLAVWAEQIAALARAQAEPVILLGHSRGGIVISEVAERVPDHIATLVYLTAFLVPSGETLASTGAKQPRTDAAAIAVRGPDGTSTLNLDAVGAVLYNTTPPDWVERAKSRFTPEPVAVFGTPLSLTAAGFGRVPRAYIECSQDNIVPLALQREMQRVLPCAPVITLGTDHSPFYSAPQELAAALLSLIPPAAAA